MNDYYRDDRIKCCNLHPKMLVVGVCALCLNERLLILASKQAHLHRKSSCSTVAPKRPSKALPKIFALANLLNRLDIKHQKTEVFCTSSTSQEDSFISIKFEENGVASWDNNGKNSKVPLNDTNMHKDKEIKSVVEHVKPRTTLRWRRRIGHLFQVLRWKRFSKGNMCHVGTKLEGAKVKYGWIRTLTKRRT
ncbi:uncharacterized protein [Henckelia pumila]|uniref:uncharacterized protein n=1 Tax=Henckelia pumila TaxID=405737 RepID=UPI003C6DEAE5